MNYMGELYDFRHNMVMRPDTHVLVLCTGLADINGERLDNLDICKDEFKQLFCVTWNKRAGCWERYYLPFHKDLTTIEHFKHHKFKIKY